MCFTCGGRGKNYVIHLDNIITDDTMTLEDVFVSVGATKGYLNLLRRNYADYYDTSFNEIPSDVQRELTYGITDFNTNKTSYCIERVLQNKLNKGEDISELYSFDQCSDCDGYRISRDSQTYTIHSFHIGHLMQMSLRELRDVLREFMTSKRISTLSYPIVIAIVNILDDLIEIHCDHLSLGREMKSLSGGELQRVFLYDHLKSDLDGLIYVFDEPTSGLHASEKYVVIEALERLCRLGNTVLVVSHDQDVLKASDHIIEIGSKAGVNGGEIVFEGSYNEFINSAHSLSASYFKKNLLKRSRQSKSDDVLHLQDVTLHNLKAVSVDIPLNKLVGIAGVSGSGKSSLMSDYCVPMLKRELAEAKHLNQESPFPFDNVIEISQEPIGRKSNSIPLTYLSVWDAIRNFFAKLPQSKQLELSAGDFSFNSKGACPHCKGSGEESLIITNEIMFKEVCHHCHGTRFTDDPLRVVYRDKNISDVLNMSIDEILAFFGTDLTLKPLEILSQIGMGYIQAGQATSTLSGGEAQRVKLAKELGSHTNKKNFYVMDEPSMGLSLYDIEKLSMLLDELVKANHTVVIVEHNLELLKICDALIELGPKSGLAGGLIIAEGTPEKLKNDKKSITGRYL